MEDIYLDHNATAPLLPQVADALDRANRASYANPASQHAAGRRARRVLEDARHGMAKVLGASTAGMAADRLVLTSGGTEANNHALRGLLGPNPQSAHMVISAIEHPSITAAAKRLEQEGVTVDRLPVGQDGIVRVDALGALLRNETCLVSVMLGNNETGVLQPVTEIVRTCSARGIPVHTDATQVVGKLPVDFQTLGVAMMTFTAHKFHGPRGVGGLLVHGELAPTPLLAGQSQAERPGTPAVELAIGMHTALELSHTDQIDRNNRMTTLRDRFETQIQAEAGQTVVLGKAAQRLPHTSCLAFVGLDRQAMQMALDREGLACSTGSACASGSSEPSPTLVAMGLPVDQIRGALRFSLGATTTAAEVDEATRRILNVCKHLRRSKDG